MAEPVVLERVVEPGDRAAARRVLRRRGGPGSGRSVVVWLFLGALLCWVLGSPLALLVLLVPAGSSLRSQLRNAADLARRVVVGDLHRATWTDDWLVLERSDGETRLARSELRDWREHDGGVCSASVGPGVGRRRRAVLVLPSALAPPAERERRTSFLSTPLPHWWAVPSDAARSGSRDSLRVLLGSPILWPLLVVETLLTILLLATQPVLGAVLVVVIVGFFGLVSSAHWSTAGRTWPPGTILGAAYDDEVLTFDLPGGREVVRRAEIHRLRVAGARLLQVSTHRPRRTFYLPAQLMPIEEVRRIRSEAGQSNARRHLRYLDA